MLALYVSNAAEVEPARVAWVVLAAVAAAAILLAAFAGIFRDLKRGALAASLVLLLFFTYGHAFDLALELGWPTRHHLLHVVLGGAWVAILTWGALRLRRAAASRLDDLTRAATIMAAILVALSAARLPWAVALDEAGARRGAEAAHAKTGAARRARAAAPPAAAPDVYYIILDGYARADVLERVFQFDNGVFLAALERRGFFVASKSLANYSQTYLSLASSLNMSYLDEAKWAPGRDRKARLPYYRLIQDPLVGRLFRARGYRFVHFATNYGGTEESRIADEVVRFRPRWLRGEFMAVLFRSTALRPFEPSLAEVYRRMFDRLVEQARAPGPKLVFVHFTLPHNPYVFDREGNVREDIPLALQWTEKTGGWANRAAYVAQLEYVNRRVIETVDALLARSAVRPVILLQADHGSAFTLPTQDDASVARVRAFLWERLSILNAFLVPDELRSQLDPELSPVNSFRIVCNGLIDTDLELLPNRHYFSWYEDDGELQDVTRIVPRRAPIIEFRRRSR